MFLKKQYILTLLSFLFVLFSYAQKTKKLGYTFDNTTYNFGEVAMWENQPALFTFTNNTGRTQTILPIFSEVDLEVIYPEGDIMPNETVTIKAIYYTGGTGNFSRKFPLYFGDLAEPIMLKVTGDIKKLSPNAYINCPNAKPELAKQKSELFVNVTEMDSDIPLGNVLVQIINLSNDNKIEFYTDKMGNFDTKLPQGNYEVIIDHPNYKPHQNFLHLGTKPTAYLKLSLTPFDENNPLVENPIFSPIGSYEEENEPIVTTTEETEEEITLDVPIIEEEPVEQVVFTPTTPSYSPPNINETIDTTLVTSSYTMEEPIQTSTYTYPSTQTTPIINENIIEEEPVEQIVSTPTTTSYSPPSINESIDTTPVASSYTIEEPIQTSTYTYPNTQTTPIINETVIEEEPVEEQEPISTPTYTYSYTPPEYTPPVIDEIIIEKQQTYTISVIDEETYLPINLANINIWNGSIVANGRTDAQGYYTAEMNPDDYLATATALGYENGEINISKNASSNDIHRIFLKKKKEEPTPVVAISTPAENIVVTPPPTENTNTTPVAIANTTPPVEENEERLDSLELLIAQLQANNEALQEEIIDIQNTPTPVEVAVPNPIVENIEDPNDAKVDSMEAMLTALLEKYDQLEEKLEDVKEQEYPVIAETTPNTDIENPIEIEESLELSRTDYAANNILFLIDVSTSMGKENKMELLQSSIKNLSTVLRDIDRVAILAYNQKTAVILESVLGDEKDIIQDAIDSLKTGGLTYGVNGIQKAYEMLEYYYIGDGNNQIILATDGLFSSVNNNMTEGELNKLVKSKVNEGIKMSVIGFGKDQDGIKLMEKLARNGDGQFIQIKNKWETENILINEIKLNSKK
ncbi:MAG: VWA domain-containing protein [Chitinophagales bacterium]